MMQKNELGERTSCTMMHSAFLLFRSLLYALTLKNQQNIVLIHHYQELAEGNIRYITISPELDGVQDMIPTLKELGIVVGIGHSGATYDRAMDSRRTAASTTRSS